MKGEGTMSQELKAFKQGEVSDLQRRIQSFLEKAREIEENTDRSALNVDQRSDFVILYQVQDKLHDVLHLLTKMSKPVIVEGYLEKQANGRYHVNGLELASGSYVEVFNKDEDGGFYVPSRIEYYGNDYYIVDLGKETPIEGRKVRLK